MLTISEEMRKYVEFAYKAPDIKCFKLTTEY